MIQTIDDLRPGSPALADLNAAEIDKPMITVFGSEQSPVHWRWLNNVVIEENRPSFLPLNTTADGSGSLQNNMAALEDLERDLADLTQALGVAFSFSPFLWSQAAKSFHASNQLTQGANWLQTSESNWNELTGANDDFEPVEVVLNTGILTDECAQGIEDGGWGWYYAELTCEEQIACWVPATVSTFIPVMGVSDGLVHQLTAQLPGACVLSNVGLNLPGVNHQELVNHLAMTIVYDSILDGEINDQNTTCSTAVKEFFRTI